MLFRSGKAVHESGDEKTGSDKPATEDAGDDAQRDVGQRGEPGANPGQESPARTLSLIKAAAIVLEACGRPMNCKEIVDTAFEMRVWTPGAGKTPANTLHAAINRQIATKGQASRFAKAGRGLFDLNR